MGIHYRFLWKMTTHTMSAPAIILAAFAIPLTMANSQIGTITYYENLFQSLYDKGIYDHKCNTIEPEQHSCWNGGKLYCDFNYTCVNKECIRPIPNKTCDDNVKTGAPRSVKTAEVNGKVNFYADVSQNGCNETKYETSTECIKV